MHPALSVIFFTTLSGAGYGLLFWTAFASLFVDVSPRPLLWSIALAIVLSTIGLLSSLLHLGKPARAWRAFSQWRTSWLSREGVAAMGTFALALLLGATLLPMMLDGSMPSWRFRFSIAGVFVAVLTMCAALATVHCTAMIYGSLKPIPAWRHRIVPWVYGLFALFTGGLLYAAIATPMGGNTTALPALGGIVAALALMVLKLKYWHDIDVPLPATRGDAVGLPQRTATVFERPHTEANYLTKEMGFVVARRYAAWLRAASVVLFAMLPVLVLFPALLPHIDGGPWYAAAAVCAVAGAFVERWLFFAEAKHLVTLYY